MISEQPDSFAVIELTHSPAIWVSDLVDRGQYLKPADRSPQRKPTGQQLASISSENALDIAVRQAERPTSLLYGQHGFDAN